MTALYTTAKLESVRAALEINLQWASHSDAIRSAKQALSTLDEVIAEVEWRPIWQAKKVHQHELLGYNPDIGRFNMHWRDDKQLWCYTWNQEPCHPTHFTALPQAPTESEGA